MAKTSTNARSGFTRAQADAYDKHRIIGLSIGEVGSRKTRFWLEAPGPIAAFSLDKGLEGVVNKVLEESPTKEIQVWEQDWFPTQDEDLQDRATELRDEFLERYTDALTWARTIVVDKESELWQLFRYAEFGPEAKGNPKDFDALNQRYRRWINQAKASDVNLGLIEGLKDAWGMKARGNGQQGLSKLDSRVRNGFNELDGLVHVCLTHTGVCPSDWMIEVGKVRGPGALAVAGQTFTFEEVGDFSTLACLIFPDSEPEEWAA